LEIKMKDQKLYWLREELACAEEFMALVPALRDEFLAYHTDFVDGDYAKGIAIVDLLPGAKQFLESDHDYPWKTEPMKYTWKSENVNDCYYQTEHARKNFPTACALTEKWADNSGMVGYSILEKNTIIHRHTGRENRDNEFVRIHVPLLVPPGDIFFECEGVEIDWSDIWGFNNQLIHSAHNRTDKRRLIFLIDISRKAIGLPDDPPYDPERELKVPEFVRGVRPKQLRKHQL
jgi:hypothetical protein